MPKILIHCIGDKTHGMGHVLRCLNLADELSKRGILCEFSTDLSTPGCARIRRGGYAALDFSQVKPGRYSACIVDLERGPDRVFLNTLRLLFPRVINIAGSGWTLQDYDAVKELADLEIYQSILTTEGDPARVLSGTDYMIINPAYAKCMPDYDGGPVVVSFGGSDPHGLLDKFFGCLMKATGKYVFVVGPAARGVDVVPGGILTLRNGGRLSIDMVYGPQNMVDVLMGASLSLIQLGMTAYESLAAGVAPLLVNISPDHERTSVELERRGCAINLGMWDEFDGADIRTRIEWLLARPDELRRMGQAGQRLVDGKGVMRVAEKICQII